jgi:hypothetical protein
MPAAREQATFAGHRAQLAITTDLIEQKTSDARPYDPATDKEFAPWAPEEGTPQGASYLTSLEDSFRAAMFV